MNTHRRVVLVPRSPAVGWDSGRGFLDDPPEYAGRAALTARCLAQLFASDSHVAGWTRRHRLTEYRSCFTFWAPDASATDLADAVAGLAADVPPAVLASLADRQLRQALQHEGNPVLANLAAVQEAAWGRRPLSSLGDATTLSAITEAGFGDHLAEVIATAAITSAEQPPGQPSGPRPSDLRWRGGIAAVDRAGEQCRIAVQIPLAAPVADGPCVAVLVELLDGVGGLIHQRLRSEAGLAYGSLALARQDGDHASLVVGISLRHAQLEPAVAALRQLLDEIATGELGADRLDTAAVRVEEKLAAQLDDPFAALDDRRRARDGEPTLNELAATASAAAVRLATGPRLADARRAVGYVGTLDDSTMTWLEELQ